MKVNEVAILKSTKNGFALLPVIVAIAAFVLVGGSTVMYQIQKQNRIENAQLRNEVDELRKAQVTPSEEPTDTPAASVEPEPNKEATLLPKVEGTTSAKSTVTEPAPPSTATVAKPTPSIASLKTSTASTDAEINKTVSFLKGDVAHLTSSIKTAETFVSTARDAMIKYPTSTLIQQSGQQVVDESNDLIFILKKLLAIQNDRIAVVSKHLGRGTLPSNAELSGLKAQYENYFSQYERSNAKVESLLTTLSVNVSSL